MRLHLKPSLGLVFFFLTTLQAFGLYIFLKGFLLTRQTFDLQGRNYSSWDRFPITGVHTDQSSSPVPLPLPTIPAKKPFKKAILILIDALRFDFLLNISNPTNPYYLNQFPIIHHLHTTQPDSSLLFQFRADPPTTTMQRIKGLMIGSLPTFIDAGANFASSAVSEDHLLHHVKSRYNSIYFMGDDTWVNLFPSVFNPNRTFESDSFKMLDLDSVDNDILSHLWPLMESNSSTTAIYDDWDIAIAHFLGVDHCGHTYGPSDPNMARKLNQMNTVITRLLDQVDDQTLLMVMGDHGMSVEGDHGGESIEELMSGLFLHSGRSLTNSNDTYFQNFYDQIHTARAERLGYNVDHISERLGFDATQYPIVAQIHLVPTLAYLLHVPIPFGNLGAIIPNVVIPDKENVNRIREMLHLALEFRKNAIQVHDYLEKYEKETHHLDFSTQKLDPIQQHLYRAEGILLELVSQPEFLKSVEIKEALAGIDDQFVKMLEQAVLEYDAFLISTIKYCGAIWAQFDTGCMLVGIVLLGFSTLSSFALMKRQPSVPFGSAVIVGTAVFLLGLGVTYLRYNTFSQFLVIRGWFEKMEWTDWICAAFALAMCCISFITKQSNNTIHAQPLFWKRWDWYIVFVADIVQSFTLGSNSFVIWEDRGTRFILATLSICWMVRNLTTATIKKHIVKSIVSPMLFLFLVRLTSITGQCREEQFPNCNYLYSSLLEFSHSISGYLTIVFLIFIFAMVLCFSIMLTKLRGRFICLIYGINSTIVIVRMVHEIYQKNVDISLEKTETARVLQSLLDVYLPRVVYTLCLIGSIVSISQFILNKSDSKRTSRLGWTTLLLWTTVLAIIQRPFAGAIVLSSPWLTDLLTHGTPKTLLIRLTLLHFLGHHLFFVTGHQAIFTSLPWKAAFVGFDDMNYYGGMILVALSTITGYIIAWLSWFIVLTESIEHYIKSSPGFDAHDIHATIFLLTGLQSVPTFLCAIFIWILRRHLMTWKIFAPRFMFQVLLELGSHLAAFVLELFL